MFFGFFLKRVQVPASSLLLLVFLLLLLWRYLVRRYRWWPIPKVWPIEQCTITRCAYSCTAIKFRPFRRTLQGDLAIVVRVYCRRVKGRRHVLCTRNGTQHKVRGVFVISLKNKKKPILGSYIKQNSSSENKRNLYNAYYDGFGN